MQAGMIIYSKKFKTGHKRGASELTMKGHAVSMLLGHIENKTPAPTNKQCAQLLGSSGFVSFDDIEEAIGKANCDKVVKFVEEKYK